MTARSTYRLEWAGDQLGAAVKVAISIGLVAWADLHERAAKDQLAPGHGLLTGRGQRSIHAAAPDYNWRQDFSAPARSAPELSSVAYQPVEKGGRMVAAVGSGLFYMSLIEDRYGFVERSHDQTIGDLAGALERAAKGAGLF